MNPTQQNQIDAYLRGELNASDLTKFESAMDNDPSFAEHVKVEQKIQQGLSEVRKAELKARLDALDVSTGWFGGVGQLASSTAVKTLGGLVVASVAGVLIYNSLDSDVTIEPTSNLILTEISSPQPAEDIPTVIIPVEELAESSNPDLPVNEIVSAKESLAAEPTKEVVAEMPLVENEAKKTTEATEFVPNVTVPQPGDLAKEEGFSAPDTEVPTMADTDEIKTESLTPVDVKTVQKKNESLKYKYFDGKLFLYGDFNDNPYEILEINGATDRRLFLYYTKEFYSIEITDKVQELSPIGNAKLINELKIIRNNKL